MVARDFRGLAGGVGHLSLSCGFVDNVIACPIIVPALYNRDKVFAQGDIM